MGLGLVMSKSIEAHGGRIWGANNANGATFAFSLPIFSTSSLSLSIKQPY